MTIQEALDLLDEMKPNMMSRKTKIKFLQEIEQLIHEEILMKHAHLPWQAIQPKYSEDTDPGTNLLAPDPYSMVYVYWLMSKVDIMTQEDGRYNIDRMQFEQAYQTLSDWWTRKFMPVPRVREIRI